MIIPPTTFNSKFVLATVHPLWLMHALAERTAVHNPITNRDRDLSTATLGPPQVSHLLVEHLALSPHVGLSPGGTLVLALSVVTSV